MKYWKQAHNVHRAADEFGSSVETELLESIEIIKRKVAAMVDHQYSPSQIIKELDKDLDALAALQIEIMEQMVEDIYQSTIDLAFEESERDIDMIDTTVMIGYTMSWLPKDTLTFVDRIKNNTRKYVDDAAALLAGFKTDSLPLLLTAVEELLGKVESEVTRMVRTEAQAAYSQGNRDALLAMGYVYAIIENDSPCEEICIDYVGAHQLPLDGSLTIDLPPYHPNCKCVFVGVFGQP